MPPRRSGLHNHQPKPQAAPKLNPCLCEPISNATLREVQFTNGILVVHAATEHNGGYRGPDLNPDDVTHLDPKMIFQKIHLNERVYSPVVLGLYVPGGVGHFVAALRLFDEATNGWSGAYMLYDDGHPPTKITAVPPGMLIVSAGFFNEGALRAGPVPEIHMPAKGVPNFGLAGRNSCYLNSALLQAGYLLQLVPLLQEGTLNCVEFAKSNADDPDLRDLHTDRMLPHILDKFSQGVALTSEDQREVKALRMLAGNTGDAIGSMVLSLQRIMDYLVRYAGGTFQSLQTHGFYDDNGELRPLVGEPQKHNCVQLQRATSGTALAFAEYLRRQQQAALDASVSHFLFWCWCARCVRSRSPMRALWCFVNCRRRLSGTKVPVPHLPVLLVSLLLMGKDVMPPWYGLLFGFCVHFPFANVPHACSVLMWVAGRFGCNQRWFW